MKKYRVTKKSIKATNNTVLKVPYCRLQNLLAYSESFAYSAGIYGWSCDYYDIGGAVISTGYAPIGEAVPSELLNKYEREAEEIRAARLTYEDKKEALVALVGALCREIEK